MSQREVRLLSTNPGLLSAKLQLTDNFGLLDSKYPGKPSPKCPGRKLETGVAVPEVVRFSENLQIIGCIWQ